MKKLVIFLLATFLSGSAFSQEFSQYLSTAKSAYSSGKLEDARFAMQQMMMELDKQSGRELLKIFPGKLESLSVNAGADEVSGSSSFTGVITQRSYGAGAQTAELQVITNSPMVAALNSLLSLPFVTSSDPNQKRIKVNGYKGLINRQSDESGPAQYEAQIPFGSALLTLKTTGISEDEITRMVNSLPIAEIAKKVQ